MADSNGLRRVDRQRLGRRYRRMAECESSSQNMDCGKCVGAYRWGCRYRRRRKIDHERNEPKVRRSHGMSLTIRFSLMAAALALPVLGAEPIRLHPRNPHYFEFRGRPTVLVTSGEHYGSVLNPDFDYKAYLEALGGQGLNLTRVFMGDICERRGNAQSPGSPLSPRPGRFLTPWARTAVEGYSGGGNKFDLDRWDPAYFERLLDFCREASRRGVVVEVVLFGAFYRDEWWRLSPLHADSNINGVGDLPMTEFHTLKHPTLVARQKEMVRKIVRELRDADNVYFEICNEPYWAKGIPEVDPTIKAQQWPADMMEWQKAIAETITEAEAGQSARHLIAINVANTYYRVEEPNPQISVLNFHYAFPPRAVTDSYSLNRVIAFDETSNGCSARERRREAWAFLMAGGAVYDNLDFSFSIDDPTGSSPTGRRQGCREVREQLGALLRFMNSLDFVRAQPMAGAEITGLPQSVKAYGLRRAGQEYAVYLFKGDSKEDSAEVGTLSLDLPKGSYSVEWINPVDARPVSTEQRKHDGGRLQVAPPLFQDDLTLVIRKR